MRQRLTAADLAAEFEVSERTIYRDIDALSARRRIASLAREIVARHD